MSKLYRCAGTASEVIWAGGKATHRQTDRQPSQTNRGEPGVRPHAAAGVERLRNRTVLDSGRRRAFFGGRHVFWICWNTAWSIIISGIMFATIVAHPDAEFSEVRAARLDK